MAKTVTAILVNYNGAHNICAAVTSILSDTTQATLQIVVVDNSQSPLEEATLRRDLPPGVNLLVAHENLGFGRGCNWGAASFPADFYWLVNPDVRVARGCLDGLLAAMEDNKQLGAVSPLQSLDSAGQWLFSPSWLPNAIDSWVRAKASVDTDAYRRYCCAVSAEAYRLWTSKIPVLQRALSGAAMLVRHECVEPASGLFDPRFFMYFEDSDLCKSLRRRGWRMAIEPRSRAVHHWELAAHKGGLMSASEPLFFSKHHPNSHWLLKAIELQDKQALKPRPWNQEPTHTWPHQTTLSLPDWLHSGWLCEISPNPLFQSSVGYAGSGREIQWPQSVDDAIRGIDIFARISSVNSESQRFKSIIFQLGKA